ncbi:MAG: tagaturonate reductase [Bacteroidota bacterium]
MKKLNRETISSLPKRPVKIVQFGEGNFLRGFVDWMVDILNERTDFNGNVQIVQPLPNGMAEPINQQQGLYHVVLEGLEKGEKVQNSRLITAVEGVLNPYEAYKDFLSLGENPGLRFIVSNTTEAGIVFDSQDARHTSVPKTFPGKLTALLYHRFRFFKGTPPGELYILPCELIDTNGTILLECVEKYIELWSLGQDFKHWLQNHVYFYNTLVDRIVPGFPRDTINEVQGKLGYEDQLVVKAEPFHLWVIEGAPQIEQELDVKKAGLNVVFTQDLSPYRTRKVRILNGAHTAMVPVGYLKGFTEVRAVAENEKMAAFLNQIIFEEIIPTLDMPKAELESYADEVLDRFGNPFIKHRLLDISLNSISKFKVRVLPSILKYMETFKEVPEGLITAFYYLILFYKGEFEENEIPLKDNETYISFFKTVWNQEDEEGFLRNILSNEALWGENLCDRKLLVEALELKRKQFPLTE